jgi:hypothetical protein
MNEPLKIWDIGNFASMLTNSVIYRSNVLPRLHEVWHSFLDTERISLNFRYITINQQDLYILRHKSNL